MAKKVPPASDHSKGKRAARSSDGGNAVGDAGKTRAAPTPSHAPPVRDPAVPDPEARLRRALADRILANEFHAMTIAKFVVLLEARDTFFEATSSMRSIGDIVRNEVLGPDFVDGHGPPWTREQREEAARRRREEYKARRARGVEDAMMLLAPFRSERAVPPPNAFKALRQISTFLSVLEECAEGAPSSWDTLDVAHGALVGQSVEARRARVVAVVDECADWWSSRDDTDPSKVDSKIVGRRFAAVLGARLDDCDEPNWLDDDNARAVGEAIVRVTNSGTGLPYAAAAISMHLRLFQDDRAEEGELPQHAARRISNLFRNAYNRESKRASHR